MQALVLSVIKTGVIISYQASSNLLLFILVFLFLFYFMSASGQHLRWMVSFSGTKDTHVVSSFMAYLTLVSVVNGHKW